MPTRFICPHCHSSIDPLDFEVADSSKMQYRICPECDDLIVLSAKDDRTEETTTTFVDSPRAHLAAEHCAL
ncbi:MAG: hypothetical protein WCK63_12135 [Betaproteobacteria bacterium]